MLTFRDIREEDAANVIALWRQCGLTRAWNDPHRDVAFAMASSNATILVGEAEQRIVASVMVGHDGHRGVLYYLSVDPAYQSQGFGAAGVAAAEAWLKAQGVWKINLMVREENAGVAGFYKKLGYTPNPVLSLGKRI